MKIKIKHNVLLIKFVALTIVLFILIAIFTAFALEYMQVNLFYNIGSIFIFHAVSALLCFVILFWIAQLYNTYVGYAFLGATFLYFLASILFLLPLVKVQIDSKIPDVFVFISGFWVSIIMQVVFCIKLFQGKGK